MIFLNLLYKTVAANVTDSYCVIVRYVIVNVLTVIGSRPCIYAYFMPPTRLYLYLQVLRPLVDLQQTLQQDYN